MRHTPHYSFPHNVPLATYSLWCSVSVVKNRRYRTRSECCMHIHHGRNIQYPQRNREIAAWYIGVPNIFVGLLLYKLQNSTKIRMIWHLQPYFHYACYIIQATAVTRILYTAGKYISYVKLKCQDILFMVIADNPTSNNDHTHTITTPRKFS